MQRYFFDRVNGTCLEFDYHGCELGTVASAVELAELIAIDLAIDAESEWTGWAIKVSNAFGQHFQTIPVQDLDVAA